jgi:Protein kinase domain
VIEEQSLAGLRLLDRYWLEAVLATGGLSVVYRGQDATLNRRVVIKVVPQRHITLYRDALRATGALTHAAMVVVLDAVEADGRLFVVQEYVEGQSFARQLAAGLDVNRALQVALQITNCVAYAHEHHVTHGDLIPGAILLDRDESVHVNNFRLPADAAYVERMGRAAARLASMLDLRDGPAPGHMPEDLMAQDVRAVGMLLWQALTTPVQSGERQDFRADVAMDVRQLVARMIVRGHPQAITSAEAAAVALAEQVRELDSQREEDEPTPPRLHALRLARAGGAHAPWAEAETLIDQPAWGPKATPPPYLMPEPPSSAPYAPYMPPAAAAPDYATIPSRGPYTGTPVSQVARSGVPSGPLRAPTSSGPLRAPTPSGPLRPYARSSQPAGYRPQRALPWADDPQVAQWMAAGQSRPHGQSRSTGGHALPKRRGLRVAPLVLIGILLFILAFVIGYFGPPLLMLR